MDCRQAKLGSLFAALLAVASFTHTLQAAEAIGLENLLEEVVRSHPLVASKYSERDAAVADKDAAEWGRFPSPTLEAGAGEGGEIDSVLRIDQPLWAGGAIESSISSADFRVLGAEAAVDETELDLTFNAIEAYVDALNQRAKLVHAKSGLHEHRQLLEMIQRRVKQQVSSSSDMKLAQSRAVSAELDVELYQQALDAALGRLTQLYGAEISDVITIPYVEQPFSGSLSELMDKALNFSPQLRRLAMEAKAAEQDVLTARGNIYPRVIARYELNDSAGVRDNRLMLMLIAQPGAGLSSLSAARSAEAIQVSLERARESAERELEESVRRYILDARAARVRFSSSRRAGEISRQVFDSYKRQYVIGKKTWLDVLNAIREVTQSQYTAEDAKHEALLADLRLAVSTGALNERLKKRQ